MALAHLILLSLIQGITEFLPISSSGHLILLPALMDWPDQGAFLDVAAHVGTLGAVLLYFRQDTVGLTLGGLATLGIPPARKAVDGTPYRNLFVALVVATIPAVVVGYILKETGVLDLLRDPAVIAGAFIGFGLLLLYADKTSPARKQMETVSMGTAIRMGLAQCFSLIPGASRAGVTMTAARALGYDRVSAARFSMLMSIPVIIASATLALLDVLETGKASLVDGAIVAVLSLLFALMAIRLLMGWLARADMTLFVIYRVAFGMVLYGLIFADLL